MNEQVLSERRERRDTTTSSLPRRRADRSNWWVLSLVAIPLMIGVLVGRGGVPGVAVGVAVLAVAAIVGAPRAWQWAGLFVGASLLPLADMGVPSTLTTVTPWAAILCLMALGVRRPIRLPCGSRPRVPVALILLFSAWLSVSALMSQERATAVGWFISFGSLVVLPVLLAFVDRRGVNAVRTAWVVMGGLLGAYAVAESFVLKANPLAGILFAGSDLSGDAWSVYRATTTLGHPLTNGMYFSIACGLAFHEFVRGRSRWHLLAACLALTGVIASGSRGSAVAALLTIVIALFPSREPQHGRANTRVRRVVLLLMLTVGIIGAAVALSTRAGSSEGSESSSFRIAEIPVAIQAMDKGPLFGVGPGVASMSNEGLLRQLGGAGAFESYWLELGVAAGAIGLGLGIFMMVSFLLYAASNRDWGGVAALVAWLVSATLTNAFEGGRVENLYLGLILALVIVGPDSIARGGVGRRDSLSHEHAEGAT